MVKTKINIPEEILDLVDESDVVIGQVPKSQAHQNPKLLHREIAVLIYDGRSRILFQKRSKQKRVFPGYWTVSCVGHVPSKMDPEAAAHKEIMEELGFDVPIKFIEKVTHNGISEASFIYRYLGEYQGGEIIIDPYEVEVAKFLTQKELVVILGYGHKITSLSENFVTRFWAGEFNQLL